MQFRKFNSIENSYSKDFIQKIKEEGFANEQFVVQEKVHGGNMSIWTEDGINFSTAKRTAFLEPDENFFNHQVVLEKLKPKLIALWNELKTEIDLSQMVLYGEIIGGTYPHEDVPKNTSAIRVQKGVSYSPNNEFYAFELLVNNEDFIELQRFITLMETNGFLYAKILFTGSLEDVLKYPNTFQTLIPEEMGLPAIKNNTCEGVIIRTLRNVAFRDGRRIFLKNKNEKWSEKEKASKRPKKIEILSEPVKELQSEIALYVSENRLDNVISKFGSVSMKDFGDLMRLFSIDIIEDFTKDKASELHTLDKQEVKQITKSISPKAIQLVKRKLRQ